MRIYCILLLFSLSVSLISCSDKKESKLNRDKDSTESFSIEKFRLSYPDDLILDSNSLIFYCKRSFDTSSLLHLQKSKGTIQGVFYEILPTYHQFADDFSNKKSKLIFFEGYSFILDSSQWGMIRNNTYALLKLNDTLSIKDGYRDGDSFTLYHDRHIKRSNTSNQFLFEKFDQFLKSCFLQNFIESRKPKAYKIKK